MTLHLLDLRPLKEMPRPHKMAMPVSVIQHGHGEPIVISRFGDDKWDFYPYIPQENVPPADKILNWCIALPDGRLLTDPEHSALLESAKDLVWALFATPLAGKKRPLIRTLFAKLRSLTPLLRWMVKLGITSFASLGGRTLEYVPVARVIEGNKAASDRTVALRLRVAEDIYEQRWNIHDALADHPWPHESAMSLAGVRQGSSFRKPVTERIPDQVLARLVSVAKEYVVDQADLLLSSMDATTTIRSDKKARGQHKGTVWAACVKVARQAGFSGTTELSSALINLRTSCYILIDAFSGIRDSEMMSIGEDCIGHRKSADGTRDVIFLHGTIYKTGVRPKPWQIPPIAETAVKVLTRLSAPLRARLREEQLAINEALKSCRHNQRGALVKRLHRVQQHLDKLFVAHDQQTGKVGVLSGSRMRSQLKQFCADHGVLGEDGTPYPLHGHQFRRTYACLVARSELGDLLTLRDHFGHWTIDMTTYYADGAADEYESDIELLEMIAEEKSSRQTGIMASYLDSDAPLANGGHWLLSWRASVRTSSSKEALIAQYAGAITLNGTGHSWCVGNARGTGCGGLCVFEAQMCVDCNYGIIGQEHRPVWEGIRDQQREALALDDIGPGGRARAQQIHDYAQKVLRRLDGQEVPT